jgi:hypothetical protein
MSASSGAPVSSRWLLSIIIEPPKTVAARSKTSHLAIIGKFVTLLRRNMVAYAVFQCNILAC